MVQDVTVVEFQQPTLLDAPVIEGLARDLCALIDEQARRKILLDFRKVRLLSSQMLGVLITLQKKSAAIKGRIVLCGLRSDLQKIFTIMRLDKVLAIVPDESKAMELLGSHGRG
jgi:anti-sigma B factor antagonist